jgi:hypothetical protein
MHSHFIPARKKVRMQPSPLRRCGNPGCVVGFVAISNVSWLVVEICVVLTVDFHFIPAGKKVRMQPWPFEEKT